MKLMHVESTLHKGVRRIKMIFEYNDEIISRVKLIKGSRWSATMQCWHLPYDENSIENLSNLSLEMEVNIPKLEKLSEERRLKYFERRLTGEKENSVAYFRQYLKVQRYSDRTIETYAEAIRTFLGYFKDKEAGAISNEDIFEFNLKYILGNEFSGSYQNQIISSIKLFYHSILKREIKLELIERPIRGRPLPEIFSPLEVENLIKSIRNIKHRAMISLIYACGLRRSELINLRITSVDSGRKMLNIKSAKGNKDRMVPLPEGMIILLREYYKIYRPGYWLFEGYEKGRKYSETSLREIFIIALAKAGITKKLTLHSLRHSYATHLLENGVDLRFIQELLGHKSSKTTEIYTHVTTKSIEKIKSPFENLKL